MAEPRVSALVLSFNCERYLGEAIESALGQTHPPAEVIVVDNGSTDGSRETALSYEPRIRLHVERERGVNRARNAAVSQASGDYLAFLDGDDIWEPRKTELQLAAIEGDERPDVVLGHVRQFLSPDADPAFARRLRVPDRPQPGFVPSALLASRRVFERVGPLSPDLVVSDGLEWFLRARSLGLREAVLPEVVAHRRLHGANQSYVARDRRGEFARLLKASIDERRRRSS